MIQEEPGFNVIVKFTLVDLTTLACSVVVIVTVKGLEALVATN